VERKKNPRQINQKKLNHKMATFNETPPYIFSAAWVSSEKLFVCLIKTVRRDTRVQEIAIDQSTQIYSICPALKCVCIFAR